jgi:transcription initiation factor TFIID subunit 1
MADDNKELNFSALDDDNWKRIEDEDERAIQKALGGDSAEGVTDARAGEIFAGAAIDQSSKADDAIDFEDIDLSDDELPDDEEPISTAHASHDLPGLTEGDTCTSNDTDDLFGDLPDSDPFEPNHTGMRSSPHPLDADTDDARLALEAGETIEDLRALNFDPEPHSRSAINQDPNIPAPPESNDDLLKLQWPDFDKNAILNFNELFKPKPATWKAKVPSKPPKPLIPTKLSLEIEADQEKLFRIPGPATIPVWQKIQQAESRGIICCEEPEPVEQADLEIFNLDEESDSEPVGGFTLRDIATLCEDWDRLIDFADRLQDQLAESVSRKRPIKDEEADWDAMFLDGGAPAKKRKVEPTQGLPDVPMFTAPSFDNFEEATARLAKRVILDRNDPYLLIDDMESERASKRRKVQHKMVRLSNGKLGRELNQRFNWSNDVAYEALKENNSNRVRATIADIPVEHSMPAQRLQYPYYRVKLAASDPHSYHRPQLQTTKIVDRTVRFGRPDLVKKKAWKGKKIPEVFRESRDMSLNDNSTAVLFEYSEEIPTVLSNFGMGTKIVNYFRRSKGSDMRPEKRELGENCILLPEDRSPFAIFGHVHPGETVPTFHTKMYRAPVFKHTPRSTDFLVGRSTTGVGGSTWYLRNIDHLFVVGQTLPSKEVPGPHSRKVTNIAKNRLKMVSYRLLRKQDRVTLSDITRHVADSNDSQNRQKLKEFLRFRKDTKDWALQEGDEMMDESGIRALVSPEDVCLLDAMQVGTHELENSGYSTDNLLKDDDMDLMGDDLPADALAQKMVPWKTTKAFIDASSGKAMLAVHGPGDPTGRGLGISFLKTSMKGGFLEQLQGPLATSADAIERQKKANNGHLYNVKNQDQLYSEAITDIWNRQKQSLEDAQEHEDDDVQPQEDEDDRFNVSQPLPTPAHGTQDGMSQVSRSVTSAMNRRKLRITRTVTKADGTTEQVSETVFDPAVIAQYIKKRRAQDFAQIDIYNYKPGLDPDRDVAYWKLVEQEKERLEKNQERRHKREKQKKMVQKTTGQAGNDNGGEGSPEPTIEKGTGTTRKCANCGQVGHIKTNKKLCPMLNGTWQRTPDDGPGTSGQDAPFAAQF